TVVGAVKFLRTEVEARVGVRADDQRRVPVPAMRGIALLGHGLNREVFACSFVEPHQATVLRCRVNGVGILRVYARIETVSAIGDETIGVGQIGELVLGGAAE